MDKTPFLQRDFLDALEQTGCVGADTGWQPVPFEVEQQPLPIYAKTHSYGEYIFDWSWAQAYQQHGIEYYPKLICAVPFTPVPSAKLQKTQDYKIAAKLLDNEQKDKYSSIHWLYIGQQEAEALQTEGYIPRSSIQFHWYNQGYQNFDEFVQRFTSRKRKSVRQERRKIAQQHLQVERLTGSQISESDMAFFYQCYQQTYLKRSGHQGYLNWAFFKQVWSTMLDKLLLVMATHEGAPVASALFFHDQSGLYGRYWGEIEHFDCLHFECCFYQGIEFAISRQLPIFNPGTQGEHKILRGFEPTWCYSAHKLHDLRFHQAVNHFCRQEHQELLRYEQQATQLLPFKLSD